MDEKTLAYLRDRNRHIPEFGWKLTAAEVAVSVAIGWLVLDPQDAWENAIQAGVVTFGAFVVLRLIVWVCALVWYAPKAQYDEQLKRISKLDSDNQYLLDHINDKVREAQKGHQEAMTIAYRKIDELTKQLEAQKKDQVFADALTEKYQHGLHEILNRPIGPISDNEWVKWGVDERTWTRQVTEMLESHGCSKQEVSHFRELHEIERKGFHAELVIDHHKSMFSERLKRLKTIINLYAETKILKDA